MQLYAFDAQQKIVFAQHAIKQQDYLCLECKQVVRRRGGMHCQTHYYHLAPISSCRLSGKSMAHLQVQSVLQAQLPSGESHQEYRFSEINRIADVVWLAQKIVFEIQCSSITATEVQSRNQDYSSLGFQVVWILHDKRFNQWRLTAAEQFLKQSPYYFTNIDDEGLGVIYDQFEIIHKGVRKKTLPPLPVDARLPKWLSIDKALASTASSVTVPKVIAARLGKWPLCFAGDMVYEYLLSNPHMSEYIDQALQLEKAEESIILSTPLSSTLAEHFYRWVVFPYRLLFQMILERSCK